MRVSEMIFLGATANPWLLPPPWSAPLSACPARRRPDRTGGYAARERRYVGHSFTYEHEQVLKAHFPYSLYQQWHCVPLGTKLFKFHLLSWVGFGIGRVWGKGRLIDHRLFDHRKMFIFRRATTTTGSVRPLPPTSAWPSTSAATRSCWRSNSRTLRTPD